MKNDKYKAILAISLETCSSCREYALKIWSDFYNVNRGKNLDFYVVFSEGKTLTKKHQLNYFAYLKGCNMQVPALVDLYGVLFANIRDVVPSIFLISPHNKVVAVNIIDDNFKERSLDFIDFIKKTVSNK